MNRRKFLTTAAALAAVPVVGMPLAGCGEFILSDATIATGMKIWTGDGGDGNFDNPANWKHGQIPGPCDELVYFENGVAKHSFFDKEDA